MNDVIDSSHMTQGSSTSFTTDRFGNVDSALALNGGWTQVPSGSYFNTPEFSITAWVYPATSGLWARLIDFGNGENVDNVVVSISSDLDKIPCFELFDAAGWLGSVTSSNILTLGKKNYVKKNL